MALKLFTKEAVLFPQEKKQLKLAIILAGLVLTTIGVLYFGFFRSTSPSPLPPSEEPTEGPTVSAEEVIRKIEFDVSFLKEPTFRALKLYGEWPIKIERKGRENPFLPY